MKTSLITLGVAISLATAGKMPHTFAAEPPTAAPTPPVSGAAPSASAAELTPGQTAAFALLKKVEVAMLRLKTYSAECRTTSIYEPDVVGKRKPTTCQLATLTAEKPNFMRYDSWPMACNAHGVWTRKSAAPTVTFVCDGKTKWQQYGANCKTSRLTEPEMLNTQIEPWDGFYATLWSPYGQAAYYHKQHTLMELRTDGHENVEGVPCDKVFVYNKSTYKKQGVENWTTWYIGPDGLVRRKLERVKFDGEPGHTTDAVLRNIRTNFPIASVATTFAYHAPKGVIPTPYKFPPFKASLAAITPPLLGNGVAAPDFVATDIDGMTVKLSDYRGKVVVVDFWASWCGPCKASMPHNQEVAKKLQAENIPFVLLAVDDGEDQAAFAKWVKAHPEYDSLKFVFVDHQMVDLSDKLYSAKAIPAQFVIDGQGIIRASFLGYGGPTGDLEKAIRAATAAEPEPTTEPVLTAPAAK